jgi:aryl-alcohol dehydrogenase-like predicted oxidoreductase
VRIGLGTGRLASLGAGNSLRSAGRLVGAAISEGVTLIDTADTYGSTDCETWLGRLLQPYRRDVLVSTKAGCPFVELPWPLGGLNQIGKKARQFMRARSRFDSGYLTRCIDGSLRRLRRERLDVFLLHEPPVEAILGEEWRSAIVAARNAGKIAAFGVSSPVPSVLHAAAENDLCDVLQVPLGVATPAHRFPLPLMVNHVFGRVHGEPAVADLANELGLDMRALIVAYACRVRGTWCVLTGTRDPDHLRSNIRAAGIDLPGWATSRLERLYHHP